MTSQSKTPPKFAKQLGISPEKVIGFIRSGELTAINVASRGSSRPQWIITPEAEAEFLAKRQSRPPVPVVRTRQKSQPLVKEYF